MKLTAAVAGLLLGVAGAICAARLPPAKPVVVRESAAVPQVVTRASGAFAPPASFPSTPVMPITGASTYPVKTGYYGPYSGGSPDLLDRPTAMPINHRNGGLRADGSIVDKFP